VSEQNARAHRSNQLSQVKSCAAQSESAETPPPKPAADEAAPPPSVGLERRLPSVDWPIDGARMDCKPIDEEPIVGRVEVPIVAGVPIVGCVGVPIVG
jgi:hypothetical protein